MPKLSERLCVCVTHSAAHVDGLARRRVHLEARVRPQPCTPPPPPHTLAGLAAALRAGFTCCFSHSRAVNQGYQPDQSAKALQRLPLRVTHAGPVAHACLSASARPAGGPALLRPPLSVSPGTSCHTPHTSPKLEFKLSYATGAEPRRWRVGSAGHTHASPRPPTTHRDPVEHPAGPDWAGACPAGADPAAPGGGVARLGPRGVGLFRRRRQARPLLPSPASPGLV